MANTPSKKKKFSLTTLLSLVIAVLPLVLDAMNNDADSAHVVISKDGTNRLSAHVVTLEGGEIANTSPIKATLSAS